MKKQQILMIFTFTIILFIQSCTRIIENNQNSSVDVEETAIPTEKNDIATKTPISTPELILSSIDTQITSINKIKDIRDDVLVYQFTINNGELAIEYSLLDFSHYSDNKFADIKKDFFVFPVPVKNFRNLWDIYFVNNEESLIYLSDGEDITKSLLYRYDIENSIISKISNKENIFFANISHDQKHIVYLLRDGKLYIVDLFGKGKQFCSDYYITSNVLFSPNNDFVAFIADDSNLYLLEFSEHDNPSLVNSKYNQDRKSVYNQLFAWSNDSKMIIYGIKLEKEKEIICSMEIDSGNEICYESKTFSHINGFVSSDNNQLIISGMKEPINHDKCFICTLEQLNMDLYLLDMNNGELSQIAYNPYSEVKPIWIEDYQYILYESYQQDSDTWQIFITDPEGSFHEQLTYSDIDTYLYQE